MKKIFALCALFIAFTGCTSSQVTCTAQSVVVSGLTPAIATGLQCSNPAAITASLNQIGANAGICTTPVSLNKPQLSSDVCTLISGLLVTSLAGQIPATWGCTAANASAQLQGTLTTACTKL